MSFSKGGVYKPKKYVGVNRISMVQGAGMKTKGNGTYSGIVNSANNKSMVQRNRESKHSATYTTRGGEKFLRSALGMGLCSKKNSKISKSYGRGMGSDFANSEGGSHAINYGKGHLNDIADRVIGHVKDKFFPKKTSANESGKSGGLFKTNTKPHGRAPNPSAPGFSPRSTGVPPPVGAPTGNGGRALRNFHGRANTRPPRGVADIRNSRGGNISTKYMRLKGHRGAPAHARGKGLIAGYGGV